MSCQGWNGAVPGGLGDWLSHWAIEARRAGRSTLVAAFRGRSAVGAREVRLLDGFKKLIRLLETGINFDRVPGTRGPLTFRDLCLRQYVVVPSG
ncbi:hypothetical protein ACIRPX_42365 [Streptomyces sp. NPDC101225]|uniref:hypothetical protein n=1 Tax=Streptomyces sp. NPDC101225 TaxID=3366135 RepID=UPI0037FC4BC1